MDLHAKNGGPAFPAEVDNNTDETVEGFLDEPVGAGERHQYRGMTLRDYFAAKAMQAALQGISSCALEDAERVALMVPHLAYVIADAMLAEREK